MDFKQVLRNRKNVKEFSSQRIPEYKVNTLLEAASLAPSWSGSQYWRVVVVKDEAVKERISETLDDRNSAKYGIFEAPVLLVVCAMPEGSAEIDGREYYLFDTGIAMEHMILAAADEGLGSCWIGEFDEQKIKALLRISKEYRVVALSPIGYPKESSREEIRLPLSESTFTNQWGSYLN